MGSGGANQLEHGQPVAQLAAVLLQEVAGQLEHVALVRVRVRMRVRVVKWR